MTRAAANVVAGSADTDAMDAPSSQSEAGFGLIELVISMVIMQVALLGLLAAFGTSAAALGRAGSVNTGVVLADAQMEMYRAMPYDAIGLDTAGAPTTGMYVADTAVCPAAQTPVCGNTGPKNNGAPNNLFVSPWSCTVATGSSSVSLYYSSNGANPCIAHRTVSGAGSPDGKTLFRRHLHPLGHRRGSGLQAHEAGHGRRAQLGRHRAARQGPGVIRLLDQPAADERRRSLLTARPSFASARC